MNRMALYNSIKHKVFFAAAVLVCATSSFAQELFDQQQLEQPLRYSVEVAKKLDTLEVYEYKIPKGDHIVLKNGFRQSGFVNAQEWLEIKDEVDVLGVDIVYSKYPIRNGSYKEIYPLLFKRIKATLELDPALNNEKIPWRKVWQTHCVDNEQVDQLYHGVVISYVKRKKPGTVIQEEQKEPEEVKETVDSSSQQEHTDERPESYLTTFILNAPNTPDSIKRRASSSSQIERDQIVYDYYARTRGTVAEDKSIENPIVRMNYIFALEAFMHQFPTVKPVVGNVLDRHPEWDDKIVVNDWTGSMYGYGSQVLLWHLMHLDSSGISTITLFNDGNNKTTEKKAIGRTGGIYTEEANNAESLIDLFSEVMKKGGGGDGPENDVEAILKASKDNPDAEIVLIADNGACVRDISLADQIQRPVRIVLCGYTAEEGVNPDYVYLAAVTGGGIYTIEEDIENISANFDENGAIQSYDDDRLNLSSPQCFDAVFGKAEGRRYSLKSGRFHKKQVRILNASNENLTELPAYVYKMKGIQALNISKNPLRSLSEEILTLRKISVLEADNCQLSALPENIDKLGLLEYLYVSNNRLALLSEGVYDLDFLIELDASNNQLTTIDKFDARTLERLHLQHNKLKELPSLTRQRKLTHLDVSYNELSEFPDKIPFHRLETLNLTHNSIERLPEDLTVFENLKALDLTGNPISKEERLRIREALFHVDLSF